MKNNDRNYSLSSTKFNDPSAELLHKAGISIGTGLTPTEASSKFGIDIKHLNSWLELTEYQRNTKLFLQVGKNVAAQLESGRDPVDIAARYRVSIETLLRWMKFLRRSDAVARCENALPTRKSGARSPTASIGKLNDKANYPTPTQNAPRASKSERAKLQKPANHSSNTNSFSCPKCQSTEWKVAQLVHEEGIHTFDSTSSSSGIGIIAGKVAVGVTKTATSGIQQSTLSQLAAPPSAPPSAISSLAAGIIVGMIALLLLYGAAINSSSILLWIGLIVLFISIAGIADFLRHPQQREVYEEDLDRWKRTKMCTRCGCFYD